MFSPNKLVGSILSSRRCNRLTHHHMMTSRNPTKLSRSFHHTHFSSSKMFDRTEDQTNYELTKQQLEKGYPIGAEPVNTPKKSKWKKRLGIALLVLLLGGVAMRKLWKMRMERHIREQEEFSQLVNDTLDAEELAGWSEDKQMSIVILLYMIRNYMNVASFEEFGREGFVRNLFAMVTMCEKATLLSDAASQIISHLLARGSPQQIEQIYRASTQQPDYSVLQVVVRNLKRAGSTLVETSDIDFEYLALMSSPMSDHWALKLTGLDVYLFMAFYQIPFLSIINRFFSNPSLGERLLNDYQNELIQLFENDEKVDRFVALIAIGAFVDSAKSGHRPIIISEDLVEAMKSSADKVENGFYKDLVATLERQIQN